MPGSVFTGWSFAANGYSCDTDLNVVILSSTTLLFQTVVHTHVPADDIAFVHCEGVSVSLWESIRVHNHKSWFLGLR